MTTKAKEHAPDGVVRIEIGLWWAGVSPPHETLLAPLLTCSKNTFEGGGPLGHRRRRKVEEFYRVEDGVLLFPVNMVPEVEAALRQAGHEIQVGIPPEPNTGLVVDHEFLRLLPDDEKQMLEAVLAHPAGLIELGRPGDLPQAVGLVCRLWPTARILIPVPTRSQVRSLCEKVWPTLGNRVQTVETLQWNSGGCLVCTLAVYDNSNRDDWDVVLYPEPKAATARGRMAGFRQFSQHRHYGFLPRGNVLSKRTSLALGCLSGPIIYRAPDPRGHAANVQVMWLTPPWAPPCGNRDALERKRSGFWHNDSRNDFIAAVAHAVETADPAELAKLALPPDYSFAGTDGIKPRITILVESSAHGQELVRRLPGWTLWSMSPVDRQRREHEARQSALGSFYAWALDRKILTTRLASELETIHADVLIRADAGSGALSIQGFPPRSSQPGRRVTLIDLADDFDHKAVDASRRRQVDYTAQGWAVLGAPRWLLDGDAPVPGKGDGQDGQWCGRRWGGR